MTDLGQPASGNRNPVVTIQRLRQPDQPSPRDQQFDRHQRLSIMVTVQRDPEWLAASEGFVLREHNQKAVAVFGLNRLHDLRLSDRSIWSVTSNAIA
jgi:hypothetical protein